MSRSRLAQRLQPTSLMLPRTLVALVATTLAALVGGAGCASEVDDAGEEVGTSEDALGGLGPCPPCPTSHCASSGVCIGTRKGTKFCKPGATTAPKTTRVDPEKWIVSASCDEWFDRTSGEDVIHSRTCRQRAYGALREVGVCQANKVGTGPYVTQWHYTVYGVDLVARTRSQVQFQVVNPVVSSSPWTPWSSD